MSTASLTSLDFLNTITSACPLHDHRTSIPRPSFVANNTRGRRLSRISCHQRNTSTGDSDDPPRLLMDRRDVLVALGGMYGAAGKMALANPVMPPDLATCHPATSTGIDTGSPLLQCCPPYTSADIKPYKFPKTTLRVRRPAEEVINDDEYMTKYKDAVTAMKNLDSSDPWNYYQQAKIHCAYCNEGYDQVGFPTVPLQVHGSWFFLPWHRFYIYFYERILGKLIDDDTFALPYWRWDDPKGMVFPSNYTDTASTLYDANRNPNHMPPAVLDYQYGYKDGDRTGVTPEEIIQENLTELRRAYKQSLPLAELFMGDPLVAGQQSNASLASGRLEVIHNAVHQWVGPTESPHLDMGNFVTAAKDSVFFGHHAQVDRLWEIYRSLRGYAVEFNTTDWLDSTFIFYDENKEVVSVQVKDTLNMSNFSYTYEEVSLPWWSKKPTKKATETKTKKELALVPVTEFGSQPRNLESTIRVIVPRPKNNRTKSEKEDKVEVLFIKGIQVNNAGPARFDVYIAAPYGDLAGPSKGELVGSYIKLPHSMATDASAVKGKTIKTALLKLGITSVVEEIDAENAEKLVVTLVPRFGDVTVAGVAIKLLQTDVTV